MVKRESVAQTATNAEALELHMARLRDKTQDSTDYPGLFGRHLDLPTFILAVIGAINVFVALGGFLWPLGQTSWRYWFG